MPKSRDLSTNFQGAVMSDERISKLDRQIEMLFLELEESMGTLREAIARRGAKI